MLFVQPFQPTPAPLTTSLAGWMPNPSVPHPTVSAGPIGLGAPNSAGNVVRLILFSDLYVLEI